MKLEKALQIVAKQCSQKEHCSYDVLRKLERWELQEKEINDVMDFLYKHKFIDDLRYAEAYTQDKLRFNQWGMQKIKMMLKRKHIAPDIIDKAVKQINDSSIQETCLELLARKSREIKEIDPYKKKAKLVRFALGRGFDYDTANKCLSLLKK